MPQRLLCVGFIDESDVNMIASKAWEETWASNVDNFTKMSKVFKNFLFGDVGAIFYDEF